MDKANEVRLRLVGTVRIPGSGGTTNVRVESDAAGQAAFLVMSETTSHNGETSF